MKKYSANIPIGIGDLIYLKAMFDSVKHQYSEINFCFHREFIKDFGLSPDYNSFLDEFGQLLFGEAPYCLTKGPFPFVSYDRILIDNGIPLFKPELSHILCKGNPINLDKPYIVINTKIRYLSQSYLDKLLPSFWEVIKLLTNKYKIVILGERDVEMNGEYNTFTSEYIFSFYKRICDNIPQECLVDLTVPSLGITAPNLKHLQQDCLIMNQAKFVINLGVGGSYCLATAVANIIAFKTNEDPLADIIFRKNYSNAVVTRDWDLFLNSIKKYI